LRNREWSWKIPLSTSVKLEESGPVVFILGYTLPHLENFINLMLGKLKFTPKILV
jgi:hypothetical protein